VSIVPVCLDHRSGPCTSNEEQRGSTEVSNRGQQRLSVTKEDEESEKHSNREKSTPRRSIARELPAMVEESEAIQFMDRKSATKEFSVHENDRKKETMAGESTAKDSAREQTMARESSVARERSRARERSVARALSQAREIIRERSGTSKDDCHVFDKIVSGI
jgi:hypothetical protein